MIDVLGENSLYSEATIGFLGTQQIFQNLTHITICANYHPGMAMVPYITSNGFNLFLLNSVPNLTHRSVHNLVTRSGLNDFAMLNGHPHQLQVIRFEHCIALWFSRTFMSFFYTIHRTAVRVVNFNYSDIPHPVALLYHLATVHDATITDIGIVGAALSTEEFCDSFLIRLSDFNLPLHERRVLHRLEATFNYTIAPNVHLTGTHQTFSALRPFMEHEINPRFQEWKLEFRNITHDTHSSNVYNINHYQFADEVVYRYIHNCRHRQRRRRR